MGLAEGSQKGSRIFLPFVLGVRALPVEGEVVVVETATMTIQDNLVGWKTLSYAPF
jgi:hypothetical protein